MTENVPTTRDDLVACLRRAGELEVSGKDQAETDSYFNTTSYRFHGPDGSEPDYGGLTNYFKAIRAAFDDRSIRRGLSLPRASTLLARPGSRADLSVSSRTHRRALCLRTANV
jgi:hypothetical protein